MNITSYLKAIYGALVAGLGSAATAYADGQITGQEGVFIAIAAVGAFGVVWGVPNYLNAQKTTDPAADTTTPAVTP